MWASKFRSPWSESRLYNRTAVLLFHEKSVSLIQILRSTHKAFCIVYWIWSPKSLFQNSCYFRASLFQSISRIMLKLCTGKLPCYGPQLSSWFSQDIQHYCQADAAKKSNSCRRDCLSVAGCVAVFWNYFFPSNVVNFYFPPSEKSVDHVIILVFKNYFK